jgi:phosphatidate cytidylyltransferase
MLRWRLLLGTLIVGALVALCWLDFQANTPGVWLLPVALVAAVLATKEVLDLAALAQLRPVQWPVYVGNLLLVSANWAAAYKWSHSMHPTNVPFYDNPSNVLCGSEGVWMLYVLAALAIGIILVFLAEMRRYEKPGGNIGNLAGGILALIYVGVLMSFAVQMRFFWGIGALAVWVIVVKMGDTGAYTVGRLIGRHKMAPAISPGKTIEGAFGAVVFSCLGAWAGFHWLRPAMRPESALSGPWWGWIVFGLLVGLSGMAGDLAESLLKRDVGVKDSSTWMPGFGGVLDILDSLLLSAPVAWFCWASGIVGR